MHGEQLSKTALSHYLKSKTHLPLSAEFTQKLLEIGKDYIYLISDEANNICTEQGKKTISSEHIVQALKKLEIEEQIPQIEALVNALRNQHQQRQQKKAKNIQIFAKRKSQREAEGGEEEPDKLLQVRESFMDLNMEPEVVHQEDEYQDNQDQEVKEENKSQKKEEKPQDIAEIESPQKKESNQQDKKDNNLSQQKNQVE